MENNNEQSIRIIRYGEWQWSEIIYLPETKKYIKNEYEYEYLDTGTRFIGETDISFDEVLSISIAKKSAEALLKLQMVSGVNLEKEIEAVKKK